jgi:hypothetical protein
MVSQQPLTRISSGFESRFESMECGSRLAQLEAEVAQLKEALQRRQQIGVAIGLVAQRFAISPDRAWSLLVRLSQNSHIKVRDIAQAMINAHCGHIGAIEAEVLRTLQSHLPDDVGLIGSGGDGQRPASEAGKGADSTRRAE